MDLKTRLRLKIHRAIDLAVLLSYEGGTMLGRRVVSSRLVDHLPTIKQWGGIVRIHKNHRVDIRWADGSLSCHQYLGDYQLWPGDDYIDPSIKANWDNKARRIELAHQISQKRSTQEWNMLTLRGFVD